MHFSPSVLWRTVVVCSYLFSLCSGSPFKTPKVVTESSHQEVIEKWNVMLSKTRKLMDDVFRSVMPLLIRSTSEIELTPDCQGSLIQFALALRQGKLWAVRKMNYVVIDACGKPFSGMAAGTLSDVGSFGTCLDINVTQKYGPSFRGQHCVVDFRPPLPKEPKHSFQGDVIEPFKNLTGISEVLDESLKYVQSLYHYAVRFGVCVPSTCTKNDISKVANYVADFLGVYADVPRCEVESPLEFKTHQLVIMGIFSIFGIVVILSTLVDLALELWRKKSLSVSNESDETNDIKKFNPVLRMILDGCSLRTNTVVLFSTKKSGGNFDFFNGLKVIAICGVMTSHVYSTHEFQALRHLFSALELPKDILGQGVINGRLNVDTFVFVSAVLFSYLMVSSRDKSNEKGLNPVMFIIIILKRIWRLLPIVMIIVGWMFLLPLMGSGPHWHENMDPLIENCANNWWYIPLFINNFIRMKDICMVVSWYVSLDFQLFLVFIVFFCLYVKKRVLGYVLLALLVLASIVPITVLTYLDPLSYPPTAIVRTATPRQIFESTTVTGFLPHLHFGVLVIGILTGILFAKKKQLTIHWALRVVLWIATLSGWIGVYFGTFKWNRFVLPEPLDSAIYAATFRIIWGLFLAWLSTACFYGYGGYVNSFLSWSFFVPLNRLTYLVFLVHQPILQAYLASTYGTTDFRHTVFSFLTSGLALASLAFSIFLYLVFESPLKLVDKLVFSKVLTKNSKTN